MFFFKKKCERDGDINSISAELDNIVRCDTCRALFRREDAVAKTDRDEFFYKSHLLYFCRGHAPGWSVRTFGPKYDALANRIGNGITYTLTDVPCDELGVPIKSK